MVKVGGTFRQLSLAPFFPDCFIGGCDASVFMDDSKSAMGWCTKKMFLQVPFSNHLKGNTVSGKIAMILSKSPLQLLGTGQPEPCSPSDFLIDVRRNCQDNTPGEDSSSLINN
ncbi:hypothetical protein SLEP1_g44326 [Rubroshorea leprosula]|uniref:Plant heme peroxidase family profile domain-containing protein n=1 Tax=Rubroshorea leprosula TaxID=152421 RepID=A0AAV5LGG0_9ROSI|nr:hypothetical protein SLEP1_g44326 [Rubroshorea leprosula]